MSKYVLLVVLIAGPAFAQPGTPSASPPGPSAPLDQTKRAEAKALYEAGLNHYNLGEFDAAITAFRAAYAISSAPGLLFNIAQSFRLKKDYEQASYFYATYLRLKPDAANRADVEARIAEMTKLLDEQKQLASRPPTGTVAQDGGAAQPAKSSAPAVVPVIVEPIGITNERAPRGGSLRTAGLVTAGAGAALVVTGLVFGRMAKSAERDLEQVDGAWTQVQQDQYDAGKRDNTIAVITLIAGGAAIATGATLWILGKTRGGAPSVTVDAHRAGAAAAMAWSF